MKLIFCDNEIVLVTKDAFTEGQTITLKLFECKQRKERGRSISRKVRFDKDAKDLYIQFFGKRYFYSEFEAV